MEEFLQSMKYYCEYCSQNKEKLCNKYTQLLDEMPLIHYDENAFIRPKLNVINNIFLGCKNHYRCKDHCLICKDSSRDCAFHCVKCWPNIIKLANTDFSALVFREKKVSARKMKQSKKIKYSSANIDSIEEEFMRVLKYDNNAKVSYNHFHTQLDIAVYLFINFEISKQAVIELVQSLD